eukprot:TRINITY_DN559_c0_g1_i1.p1 TRINITY_DN559_c0_g1~~TRINITY_DN559_c0_g1_i1.p1  ORF type:complete len:412 (+),score=101.71 TRINITY_DN559_c0_g1_i1:51-1238(+)
MAKLPNFHYLQQLPRVANGSVVDPKKAKLRQRLRAELEQDMDNADESRLQLVEILQELDHEDEERLVRKNMRRMQIYDKATEAQLQLEEKLRQAHLEEERALADRLARHEMERRQGLQSRSGNHNARLVSVLAQRAQMDAEKLRKLREAEATREAKLKYLSDRRQQDLQELRQKRNAQQQRQEQLYDELKRQTEEWEQKVRDRSRYREDQAVTLKTTFNVNRSAAVAEEQTRTASPTAPGRNRDLLLDAGLKREQKLKEWEHAKHEELMKVKKKHADKETEFEKRQRLLEEEQDRRNKEAEEARRRKNEELEEKTRQKEAERLQLATLHEERRYKSRLRASLLQEEILQKRMEEEAGRRQARANRFCQALGFSRGGTPYSALSYAPTTASDISNI